MKKGFTLIETLIYIALFALLIGGGVGSAYSLIASSDRITTGAMLEQEGNFLLAKIGWMLEQSDPSIDIDELINTNVWVENLEVGESQYSFTLKTRTGSGQEIAKEFKNLR